MFCLEISQIIGLEASSRGRSVGRYRVTITQCHNVISAIDMGLYTVAISISSFFS